MMKIISWNVNGLRSVYGKGFLDWLFHSEADVVCLQEIKANFDQLPKYLQNPRGFSAFFNSAQKKGYSGVAIYAKQKPQRITQTLGHQRFDAEGRILQLDFTDFTLINLYIPNGDHTKKNLPYKLEVYELLRQYLSRLKTRNVVLVGDFNIAHTEIDLARPKENKNNIMFTPQERQQIDLLVQSGYVDTFRSLHPDGGNYTWWPYFYHARERNLGWRIDYVFASQAMQPRLQNAFILKEVTGSDHCPHGIEIC